MHSATREILKISVLKCNANNYIIISKSAAKTQDKVKRGFLLNVVVRKSPVVLELLSSEDEPLLIGRNAFLVLNLLLHIFDLVCRIDIERNGLARKRLDKDLHFCLSKQMGMPKTTADKITLGALLVAFTFGIAATTDTTSSASNDPWLVPVILAVILSLCWH